jgi:hypothetical protein
VEETYCPFRTRDQEEGLEVVLGNFTFEDVGVVDVLRRDVVEFVEGAVFGPLCFDFELRSRCSNL